MSTLLIFNFLSLLMLSFYMKHGYGIDVISIAFSSQSRLRFQFSGKRSQ